jgi:hypothetical protein
MFDEATVKKYLSKVKESKSQGSDSIHLKLIKEMGVSISKPVKLFSSMWDISVSLIIFSIVLQMIEVRLIGLLFETSNL